MELLEGSLEVDIDESSMAAVVSAIALVEGVSPPVVDESSPLESVPPELASVVELLTSSVVELLLPPPDSVVDVEEGSSVVDELELVDSVSPLVVVGDEVVVESSDVAVVEVVVVVVVVLLGFFVVLELGLL